VLYPNQLSTLGRVHASIGEWFLMNSEQRPNEWTRVLILRELLLPFGFEACQQTYTQRKKVG
jgi:hypothetical protein